MKNKLGFKELAFWVSLVLVVAAVAGVITINWYHKNKSEKKRQYWQKYYALEYFYTYDKESDEFTISDPQVIEAMQRWDREGCSFIYAQKGWDVTNDDISRVLHDEDNPEQIKWTAFEAAYYLLAKSSYERNYIGKLSYEEMASLLKYESDYSLEELEDALDVFIYGGENVGDDNQYGCIFDVPRELQVACCKILDSTTNIPSEEFYFGWKILISIGDEIK